MKSVSGTVNLPALEKEVLEKWASESTFERSNELRQPEKEFVFYDGPPFANGLPHYGHLLANTVKDSVPRYWCMRGYRVERRFGWDCHGFPVECEIEKREGLSGRPDILEMGIANFNEKCRASVLHYAEEWQRTITRLGRWVDWSNQYRTMDRNFMETVWWVLRQLHEKGLFYRGHYVVAYSPKLSAVLSNFEANQNYKDVQDPALTVKFKCLDEDSYFLAWTTTPWTLVSNLALAVGPELVYAKARFENETYIVAESRLKAVFGDKPYDVLDTFSGSALVGRRYRPLFPYYAQHANAFKVLSGDFVSTDEGTGIVHMAPAYGEDDFNACKEYDIELVDPLDEEARFTAKVPEYQGQFVKDADKNIIKDLKAQGAVYRHETIVHSYPHCERTEGPLIYRAIPSWYIRVESIKEKLVANNKKINWVPEHLRDGRMGKWLENARDWAISRNRFWGTPIPVWICERDDTHMEVLGSVAELEEKTGQQVNDLHKHFIDHLSFNCASCSGKMRRVPEVFDCWFESGSMPYAQMHYPFENKAALERRFPAHFIAEGLDQTRGWFYTLSIISAALFDQPAFKNVVVNGLVLAKDGKKMSKRLGNYTPPETLLDEFGADSVRLYMLSSPILKAEPLRFTDEGVRDTTRAVILPYWNAFAFLSTYAEAEGWKPRKELCEGGVPETEHPLDKWMISRLQSLVAGVHQQMESYRLYLVVPEVLAFIEELTNWYIRLSRRRFWNTEGNAVESIAAFETLYFVLLQFTKVFAPFAPFITERVYGGLVEGIRPKVDSVHLAQMPMPDIDLIDQRLEAQMHLIRKVTDLGRSIRAKHQLKTRQVLASMTVVTANVDDSQTISEYDALLREELNVKSVIYSTELESVATIELKPNLKNLGKKLGSKLPAVRKELQEMSSDQKKALSVFGEVQSGHAVTIAGEKLEADDILIVQTPKSGTVSASESMITVVLETTMTLELISEGLAREVINRVQNLRKDRGLNVSDRILLTVSGDADTVSAIRTHQLYIQNETLAQDILYVNQDVASSAHPEMTQFDIEGRSLSADVQVVQ
jgi:isoleucyl-tRNA synthetase